MPDESVPAEAEVALVFGAETSPDSPATPRQAPEVPPHIVAAVTSQPRPARTPPSAASHTAFAPAAIRPRHKHQPETSETMRRPGQEGRVVLRVSISAEGVILDITVAQGSGVPAIDAAALAAARQWHFDPPIRNGRPVATMVDVPVLFRTPK